MQSSKVVLHNKDDMQSLGKKKDDMQSFKERILKRDYVQFTPSEI